MNMNLLALGNQSHQSTQYQQSQAPLMKIIQELINEGITQINNKTPTRDNHSDKPSLLEDIYMTEFPPTQTMK